MWEENSVSIKRAIILVAATAMSGVAVAEDHGNVMVLGDSITQGGNGQASYRYDLWKRMIDHGDGFDFVGSHDIAFNSPGSIDDYMGQSFDNVNEGHWNWTTTEILAGADANNQNFPTTGSGMLSGWLASYTPDTAMINLGTNDVSRNGYQYDAATILTNLGTIIDAIQADNPQVRVILSYLPRRSNQSSAFDAVRNEVNTGLAQLAYDQTTSASQVSVVDLDRGYKSSPMTYDGTHPNDLGEAFFAKRLHDAMINRLVNSSFEIDSLGSVPADQQPGVPANWTLIDNASGDEIEANANTVFSRVLAGKGRRGYTLGQDASLKQASGVMLADATAYTVTAEMTMSGVSGLGTGFIELWAGDTLLGRDERTLNAIMFSRGVRSFFTMEIHYELLAEHASLAGQELTVIVGRESADAERHISVDNVHLSQQSVPEPHSLSLLVLGGLVAACRRRR